MAEISYLLSHFNAMCDNICVVCVKPAEGYICWALSRAFYAEAGIFIVVIFKRNLTIIILIRTRSGQYGHVFQCDMNPRGGGTWVFFGRVCAARVSKLAPRSGQE